MSHGSQLLRKRKAWDPFELTSLPGHVHLLSACACNGMASGDLARPGCLHVTPLAFANGMPAPTPRQQRACKKQACPDLT